MTPKLRSKNPRVRVWFGAALCSLSGSAYTQDNFITECIAVEDEVLSIRISYESVETGVPWADLIDLAPHMIWIAFLVFLICLVGPTRVREAFSRTTKIGVAGFEFEFDKKIEEAAHFRNIDIPAGVSNQLSRRMGRVQPFLCASRFLWIDDNPRNNLIELDILQRLGVTVDLAISNEDAKLKLSGGVYDIVLTDNNRGDVANAGVKFLPEIQSAALAPPAIFYVGRPLTLPSGAFGLTTRPDELFNLIFDAIERRKG